jgi:TPR repeat protein
MTTLQYGRPAFLQGLVSRPELNGRRVIVVEEENANGRVRVQLVEESIGLLVKPSSLRLPNPGEDEAAARAMMTGQAPADFDVAEALWTRLLRAEMFDHDEDMLTGEESERMQMIFMRGMMAQHVPSIALCTFLVEEDETSPRALDTFRKAAATGDTWGNYLFGNMWLGYNSKKRDKKGVGVKHLTVAAEQGSAFASARLGAIFRKGMFGHPIDLECSVKWYERAAEQGFAGAGFEVGMMRLDNIASSPAALMLGSFAKPNDPEMQKNELSAIETFRYMLDAAADGYLPAMVWLGRYHLSTRTGMPAPAAGGVLPDRDEEEGMRLLERAHARGFAPAAEALANVAKPESSKTIRRRLRKLDAPEGSITSEIARTALGAMGDTCAMCQAVGTKYCGRCKLVRYCSTTCQRQHWSSHKKECVSPPS